MSDFPVREYEARAAKFQSLMRERGVDAVLFTQEFQFTYFAGYRTPFWQSPTRPWFLVMPQSGKPIAIIPSIGEGCMSRTWVDDIRTWSSPHPTDDGISMLADALKPFETIGLVSGSENYLRMPLTDFDVLKSKLGKQNFVDVTSLVRACRTVKSEAEINKIRRACEIGSAAFDRVPEIIHEGMAEADAFRAFKIEGLKQGADDVAFLVGGSAAGGYSDIISPPTQRPLTKGDIFMLDLGLTHDRYFCDFDRNFAIGKPTDEATAAYGLLFDATEAALDFAKPGVTCADLFTHMDKILNPIGPAEGGVGRLGHGLGLQLTEFPSLIGHDDTMLVEGMVLTIEPSVSFGDGKMLVTEENIVVRANGPELLTKRAAKEMPRLT